MGYDITFHAVSRDDLKTYLFDVIDRPELVQDRVVSLTTDPETQGFLTESYQNVLDVLADPAGLRKTEQNTSVNILAAQIAGARHPYWYARNAWLCALEDPAINALFQPLDTFAVAPAILGQMQADGTIYLNHSASGVISDLDGLLRALERLGLENDTAPPLFQVFDAARLAALREAIAYCQEHNLMLMEAADIVVPVIGHAGTDPDNARIVTAFDPPNTGKRRWFDPPKQDFSPAFRTMGDAQRPLLNDEVAIGRFLRPSTRGTILPRYYLQPAKFRKYFNDPQYEAVLYEDGAIGPVHVRWLKTTARATSHQTYHRRTIDFDRSYYEDLAGDIQPDTQPSKSSVAHEVKWALDSGITLLQAKEPDLAQECFANAQKHAALSLSDWPDTEYRNLKAQVLRASWLVDGLLGEPADTNQLVMACDLFRDHAEALPRADWSEYVQRDYVDFALTALVARKPNLTLEMLDIQRPFETENLELIQTCRRLAKDGLADAETVRVCADLLDVMRHPAGHQFLSFGSVTALQLALVAMPEFASGTTGPLLKTIVEWLGR